MTESLLRFEDILEMVASYKPDCDEDLLRRAYVFSAMAHRGQVRVSGEPYLVHPLAVARILAEMRLDELAIATGFLHDLLEDTWVSESELEAQFGEKIAAQVRALTKISTMERSFAARAAAQAETFRRMLLASVEDVRVILVKLADRLHNMRTLHFLPEAKRRAIAAETLEIYAPIAHRLGIGRIKAELEDLAFAQLYPEDHRRLVEELQQREDAAGSLIEEIRTTLVGMLEEHSIPGEVRGRIKHLYSIWSKLNRQGVGVDRVYDFLAFRVIVQTVPQCYATLGLVHQLWRPVPGRIKDYIAMPKPNAYQSLHTSVIGPSGHPFEIQIRTHDMDEIAERGIAAHWMYKEGRARPQDAERVAWLRSLVEGQQENPREFLDSLKLNLYPEEVYTFTPKGEVYAFQRGATPIDFAYRIHTEVGHHCVGARVNGRLVPLRTPLENGDIVEILTSPSQVPSRDWLEFAVTARAKNKIRAWVKSGEKEQAIEAGRRLLDREARKLGVGWKQLRDDKKLAELAAEHGFGKVEELFAAIGFGRLSPRELLGPRLPAEAEAPRGPARELPATVTTGAVILVKGQAGLLTFRARCCNPLPGDDIVGYITRGRGVAVHAASCANVRRLLLSAEREVEVEWGSEEGSYAVPLHVTFEDRPGILAGISQAITGEGGDIRSCHLATHDAGSGTVDFVVQVRDREHVRRVIAAVRGVANVLTADSRSSRRLRSPEAALPAGEASPPRRRGQRMPN
ncbi:MAG: bifunctional (p)ppGpp synthetase/guanosine-3',5'-bis(diphosphate) 3'-pyrophosphohydrolase [Thermoanaerobaculaceae bacterium]|nr:bifunctional (p)ppGpp synthetase/guanosine-3',5'-bis(diphosphate) 3'-pyrophosphohydrolase [Thermoanaerobaculaceae bacterium]